MGGASCSDTPPDTQGAGGCLVTEGGQDEGAGLVQARYRDETCVVLAEFIIFIM